MMLRLVALLLLCAALPASANPGGVGAGLRLWLDAADTATLFRDDGCTQAVTASGQDVACWKDKSGTASDVVGGFRLYTTPPGAPENGDPTWLENQFNGQPALRFLKTEHDTLRHVLATQWTSDYTEFFVFEQQGAPADYDSFFSNGPVPPEPTTGPYHQIHYRGGNFFWFNDNSEQAVYEPWITELKLYSARGTADLTGLAGRAHTETFADGERKGTSTTTIGRSFAQYRINQNRAGAGLQNSKIAEVIVYDRALSDCEMEQVDLYLGQKYGRDFLGTGDRYDWPAPYTNDVNSIAAIPSACGGTIDIDTAVSDIATLSNPSSLDAGDYLIFGNDNGGYALSSNVPSGYDSRVTQRWRVDANDGDVGTVTVSFDLSGVTLPAAGVQSYALLINTDGDFANATVQTGAVVSGQRISFSGVTLQHGQFFTIAFQASAPTAFSVTATVTGGNGRVSCTPGTVNAGDSSSCTAVPDAGYQVQNWTGACATAGSNAHCTLKNIQADQVSTVAFVAIPPATYSVSATVTGGNYGSVNCAPASVTAGGGSQCTAVADPGFRVLTWGGDCASAGTNAQCSLTNIQANQTSTVSFELIPTNTFSVTATVVDGNYGTVSCLPTSVLAGGNSTCYAVPQAGFQVKSWGGDCAAAGSNGQCALTKILADQVATVSFELIPADTYSVTATTTSANGSVSCLPNSVLAGGNSRCYAVPYAGYEVQSWTGACSGAGNAGQCDIANIQSDQTSTVSFQAIPLPTFNVSATVSGGNGTVSCAPSSVPKGDSSSCTAIPDPGYQVSGWTGACAGSGTDAHCYLGKLQKDAVSTVSFSAIPASSYSVSASAVLGHGTVSCTPATVSSGGASTCTATPDTGYQVQNWGGDCSGWGSNAQCYLTKIKADKTATVSFALLAPATYAVSATVTSGHGHVSCTPTPVSAGSTSSCTAVPDAGWEIQDWGGDCAGTGSAAQCDLTNIQTDQSATVSFVAQAVPSYSVSATVDGGNGSVSCAPSTVPQGDSASCTALPDTGYQVAAWTGDCSATGHRAERF